MRWDEVANMLEIKMLNKQYKTISGLDSYYGKTKSRKSEVVEPSPWNCPVCTYENYVEHLACTMCGSERPEQLLHARYSSAEGHHEIIE